MEVCGSFGLIAGFSFTVLLDGVNVDGMDFTGEGCPVGMLLGDVVFDDIQ